MKFINKLNKSKRKRNLRIYSRIVSSYIGCHDLANHAPMKTHCSYGYIIKPLFNIAPIVKQELYR